MMKEKGWKLDEALEFVKSKRPCVNPNANFLRQLETYQGILEASSHRHSALFQQPVDKGVPDSPPMNVPKSKGESSPEESTVPVMKMEVGDDYEAYEPPPGPSGPVDLEAELFAFKTFPQLPLIQDKLINESTPRRISPEPSGEEKGIRRRVLATTSQRIRHWHPDVYEDMDSVGSSSGVFISRSKSSPTRVFHRSAVDTNERTPPQFAVPLVASVRSPLNNSTITATTNNTSLLPMSISPKKEEMEGIGDVESGIFINVPPPPSPTPQSEDDSSSISEHDVFLMPTVLRSQNTEKTTPPKDHSKTRPVTINIIPPPSGYPTFDSSVDLQPPSTEHIRPSVGRLTLSLGVMAPDEDQAHRPVRTLSLRLRPDDSWIVKRQASEEGDDISRRPPDSQERRRPTSETTPATTTSMTPPEPLLEEENEEEVEESRRRMNVIRTLPQFQNPLPTVMAASQQ
ncbi:unnamed protein product [Hymenolepis diminuta]|uniref:DSPc domain-containing protein n=1 Tax=Hymenolepis diminuta TaxID=6216 RepID=A0A3P7A2E1_HYMDI|nr:unnamed protein product [Hymenolepis diminuta]